MLYSANVIVDTGASHEKYSVIASASNKQHFRELCFNNLAKHSDEMIEEISDIKEVNSNNIFFAKCLNF